MRRVLAGAAVAAVVFAGAGFAYSSTRTGGVTPAQFAALKSRVAKLEKSNAVLLGFVAHCLLKWEGITEYGDGHNFGYVYDNNNNPSDGQFLASALDFTRVGGGAVMDYVPVTTDTGCIGPAARARLHLSRVTSATSRDGNRVARRDLGAYGPK